MREQMCIRDRFIKAQKLDGSDIGLHFAVFVNAGFSVCGQRHIREMCIRDSRMALQKVIHILCDARRLGSVLSYTLPKGKEEVCTVLVLEKQVNLINENIGVLALRSVLRDTVENGVEDNKHTDGHKLLTEVKNVVANQAVVSVNICLLCEGIKGTVRKQLNRKCDFLCFRLVLLQEFSTEVLQGRDSTRVIVLLIGTVNACGATVDNRFLLCSEIVAADKLFAKRHNELGFENNGVCTCLLYTSRCV